MTTPTESPAAARAASERFWELIPRERWTDAQRMTYAAMTFVADETMERIRVVRDRFPDLLDQAAAELSGTLATYERQRDLAIKSGKTLQLPQLPADQELEAAADAVRAGAPSDAAVRQAAVDFRKAAQAGRWPGPEYLAWTEAVDELNAAGNAYTGARALLGLRGGSYVGPAVPQLLTELARAFGQSV